MACGTAPKGQIHGALVRSQPCAGNVGLSVLLLVVVPDGAVVDFAQDPLAEPITPRRIDGKGLTIQPHHTIALQNFERGVQGRRSRCERLS